MGLRIMNIEDIWSSRAWSELTGEERIAAVRLILREVALGLDERGGTPVLRDSIERMLEDMAPDVARLLDRVINPAEGPAPEAVAALESDLEAARVEVHFPDAGPRAEPWARHLTEQLNIKAEAGSY